MEAIIDVEGSVLSTQQNSTRFSSGVIMFKPMPAHSGDDDHAEKLSLVALSTTTTDSGIKRLNEVHAAKSQYVEADS